mmetsp:Transcript_6944/g.13873  ORF Transcript_6944/g.13873 Transcript_6944/m.13873 type:complete len:408 (-) Transcript_6944:169-1392(-)
MSQGLAPSTQNLTGRGSVATGIRPPWEKACTFEGPLLKKSEWLKKWNSRYFRIRGRTLCYYDSQMSKVARGEIPLIGAQVASVSVPELNRKFTFQIRTAKNQDFLFCALSEEDRHNWISQIDTTIHTGPQAQASRQVQQQIAARALPGSQGSETASSAAANVTSAGVADAYQLGGSQQEELDAEDSATITDGDDVAEQSANLQGITEDLDDLDIAGKHRFPSNYVPPPPPPDAEDPLSYLLSVPEPSSSSSKKQASSPRGGRRPKTSAFAKSQASASSFQRIASPPSRSVQRTSSGEAMQRMNDAPSADQINFDGPALRNAVRAGDLSLVKTILAARPDLATYQDNQSLTVLHYAAMFKHEEICMLLLSMGADATIESPSGETSLKLAPVSVANHMREYLNDNSSAV